LTNKCQKITGNKLKIHKQKNTSIFDIQSYITDNSKIKRIYKWTPKKSVDNIVVDIYGWLKINKNLWKYFK